MLGVEIRFMIRDMHRKGVSISEIARQTGHDRKTVRKVIAAPEITEGQKPAPPRARKIDPYTDYVQRRMAEGVYNTRKLCPVPDGHHRNAAAIARRIWRPARTHLRGWFRHCSLPGALGFPAGRKHANLHREKLQLATWCSIVR